jgi:FHS family L-fucose permease-like MFS transporter
MKNSQIGTYPSTREIIYPLILVNLLYFMWGFIWNLANVLVALFQETFELSNFQTSLLTSVSFLAFFALSYPAKFIIARLRTKNSIVLGAWIAAIGLFIFILAARMMTFNLFLAGTFVVFSGVTFLQIVCNPYVRALGPPSTAASRINLSQGLGAIGAFLTAYVGGGFILKIYEDDPFQGITWFYLILGTIFILLGFLVKIADMPSNPTDGPGTGSPVPGDQGTERSTSDDPGAGDLTGKNSDGNPGISGMADPKNSWAFRHFRRGFIVLLLYMGAEAILYQLMTPYFMEMEPISKARAVDISGILFLGLMTGRLLGAGILVRIQPGKLVGWFAIIAALLIVFSIAVSGYPAIYSIVLTGFFISIMFATIYSLAIDRLGRFTNEASSFLIMAISGGFFLPMLFGLVADYFSLKTSLVIVVVPLLLASWYGFRGSKQEP